MTDRYDPQGNDRPHPFKEHFSRRSFLRSLSVLPLAALTPLEALFAEGLDTADTRPAAAPVRPHLGALFNPYHRLEDWNLLGRRQPEGMPLLGSYASYAVGSVATQIIWAKTMGVDFFLASYCPSRPAQNEGVDALFEAAGHAGYTVGLYIDLQDDAGRPWQHSPQARLATALEHVASRYLSHPAYLRTASGLPVLAVTGLDDGRLLETTLSATGSPKAWGSVLRFPSAWRSRPDAQADPELAQAVNRDGLYLGFSAQSGARAVSRVIPCHCQSASAVLVSPVRDKAQGIQLPSLTPRFTGPAYVILDSFNNWGVSVPLEPGTVSRKTYVSQVARWSRSHAA